jgi:hypothetical protein
VRVPTLARLGLAAMFALGCRAPDPAPQPTLDAGEAPPGFTVYGAAPCEPVGEIQFICDLISPEDLAILPGSEWVIASGAQEGGRIHLVSVGDKTTTVLFPTPLHNERLDTTTYPTCPVTARPRRTGGIQSPWSLSETGTRRRPHLVRRSPRYQGIG